MPVAVYDNLEFLFDGGRGILPEQRMPSVPQSLTGDCSGTLSVNTSTAITFSGIGGEASYVSLAQEPTSALDPTLVNNGNLVFQFSGVYRLYGEIAYTGNDRTGPTFQSAGTGVIVLGHTNAYSRDADTELVVDRQLDFYVPTDGLEVTISVWNRRVTRSASYGTMSLTASNVDNMYILPIGL